MKIVILDGYTENPGDLSWSGFEALGELTVYDRSAPNMVVEHIGNAQVVIVNKTHITAQILDQCPTIEYIGVLATGYNIVDTEAARSRGIPVCNIPTYGTTAVAQFTFALLLEVCHHVGKHDNSVKLGEWEQSLDFCYWKNPLIELADKTIGLIGFGRIGQNTAVIAKSFGMKVLAYDEHQTEEGRSLAEYVSLDRLLGESDVVSLHCPLLPSTNGIINKNSISRMKDSVIILNTSRGPLIVEADLAEALQKGKVFAAAVDVVAIEPIKSDNPLLSCKNCLITPHIAWAPKESRQRLMDIAVQNLAAFCQGKPINVVN